MRARQWSAALEGIERALAIEPADSRILIYRAQCLMALGRRREASESASIAQRDATRNPGMLDAIGSIYSFANEQNRALEAYSAAVALAPDDPRYIFNRATVKRFLGDFVGAEADYDRVIMLRPNDFEAYKNRSDLRIQTAVRNHIAELEGLLERGVTDWRGEVQIRYALAKECEDVGEYARSFKNLKLGAKMRRNNLRYDVEIDVRTMNWIIDAFPHAVSPALDRIGEPAPIFIVGLPRSGTTLVDRILSSHSQVYSAGELNDFALALVALLTRQSGGISPGRQELVARSAHADHAELGLNYLQRVRTAFACGARFIDKMPLNFLYCGLIRRALPNAKIVHVVRDPMAVCYAIYKTLFQDAYPFSYDLTEIARYYIAYNHLMNHWDITIPGGIYRLSYEDLVADQIGESRKLIEFCGLDWEPACADFHANPAPVTTASAAQVRQRIHSSSVAQWQHYGAELSELKDALRAAGIRVHGPDSRC